MSSTNLSARTSGSVPIPIEIIPASNSRPNPPTRTLRTNYSSSDFTQSPPRLNSPLKSRFQPRPSPATGYDRLIKHSEFNDRPLHQQPSAFYSSHSNEDLLASSSNYRTRANTQPKIHHCPLESDFIQPTKSTNSFRRSFDVLNDFPDYHVPTTHHQETFHYPHDRSRSPASQRGDSPTRPPPPPATSQQQSDFKFPKDATTTSNDQQVPSTDTSGRDPNIIALEKLEQIKQSLTNLDEQVNAFTGSTRDDREYRKLDEQALKLMIRCDELLDVSADIKEKRKEMIRNVQTVVAKLESKVPIDLSSELNSNPIDNVPVVYDSSTTIAEQPSLEEST